jgi:hypothetical protein
MSKFDPKDPKTWNIDFNELDESDLQKLDEIADPSWMREPGWGKPIPLGTRLETLPEETPRSAAKGPGDSVLIHYIGDTIDRVRLECSFTEGTHAQLITGDNPPQVYQLHAPETVLILPTTARIVESPYRIACRWIFRLPPGTMVWPEVVGWHWVPKDHRTDS